MEITVAKTSPIGITPERQDYSYLPARDQHEHESEGPARAGDRREEVGVRKTHPKHSQVTLKGWGGGGWRNGPTRGWGSVEGHLGEAGGAELVLQKSPQRADGNSCSVPAAEQHWFLHQKPSRQETACWGHTPTRIQIYANVRIHRVTRGLITQNINTWIRFTYMSTIANMLNCTYTLHALHCLAS